MAGGGNYDHLPQHKILSGFPGQKKQAVFLCTSSNCAESKIQYQF